MADNHPALTGDSAPAEARAAPKHPTKGLAKHLLLVAGGLFLVIGLSYSSVLVYVYFALHPGATA